MSYRTGGPGENDRRTEECPVKNAPRASRGGNQEGAQ